MQKAVGNCNTLLTKNQFCNKKEIYYVVDVFGAAFIKEEIWVLKQLLFD